MPDQLPPDEPDTSPVAIGAKLTRMLLLQVGVACFAFLAGLACFFGGLYFGLGKTVALIVAVIFGALVWIAARSLLREAAVEINRGRQASQERDDSKLGGRPPR